MWNGTNEIDIEWWKSFFAALSNIILHQDGLMPLQPKNENTPPAKFQSCQLCLSDFIILSSTPTITASFQKALGNFCEFEILSTQRNLSLWWSWVKVPVGHQWWPSHIFLMWIWQLPAYALIETNHQHHRKTCKHYQIKHLFGWKLPKQANLPILGDSSRPPIVKNHASSNSSLAMSSTSNSIAGPLKGNFARSQKEVEKRLCQGVTQKTNSDKALKL